MRYIYLLKDPITKEVMYIGETSNPKIRYISHCCGNTGDSEEKRIWNNGLKELGLKPLFEIIDTAENKREALIKENNLIVSYIKKGCSLFNVNNKNTVKQYTTAGLLVGEYCDLVMALAITGIMPRITRYTAGNYQWSYGDFNPDLIEKKKAAKKVLNKPVIQINKVGKIVAEFDGIRIACKETGIDHRSIQSVAAGSNPKRHTAGGFYWKYKS